jgi:hypothetical protein
MYSSPYSGLNIDQADLELVNQVILVFCHFNVSYSSRKVEGPGGFENQLLPVAGNAQKGQTSMPAQHSPVASADLFGALSHDDALHLLW